MLSHRRLAWIALATLSLAGCGRTTLSPNPTGPVVRPDGGIDGGTCSVNDDCNDGLVCNGLEICAAGRCVVGPMPACDDGIECTVDRCEEAAGGCVAFADNTRCPPGSLCDPAQGGCVARPCSSDEECDDEIFCNGAEVCTPVGCAAGMPPDCGEGDTCIEGRCDLSADACVSTPTDRDGDGFGPLGCGGGDCDDSNPTVHLGAPEVCNDGLDNDCNGAADCADPVCAGFPECTCEPVETCGNGRDDDCDGNSDCRDSECADDPSCMSTCSTNELGGMTGMRVAVGSTVGRPNALRPSCRSANTAGEQAFHWTAPTSGTYSIDTFGSTYDTVLYVLNGCPGTELPGACNDDVAGLQSQVTITVMAGQEVVIVVDGFSSREGDYVLNITPGAAMEVCTDGIDNDGDGRVDCADSDCAASPSCCVPRPESCTDGVDQDCDRLIDCADPDCSLSPACCTPRPEDCSNGIDDDCDRSIDCGDFDCRTAPMCCRPVAESCTNGVDDDCDLRVDCADPDCAPTPACCTPRMEVCDNGIDDDCDLRRDCGDSDCASAPACCVPRPEDCSNGIDDDCDLLADCADPNCASAPACCVPRPEVCNNGVDDDCDLRRDCADSDCASSPACCVPVPEVCTDGVDQDCDGLVDCADSDCRATPACCVPRAEVCDNRSDDDCDLRIDCADPDCAGTPACCVPSAELCTDGADQDCDGLVDCADSDCTLDPACRPCPDFDLGSRLGRVAMGTTVGMIDDTMPACARSGAPDVGYRWTAPFAGDFLIDTNGSTYDTVLAVLDGCRGPSLACDDDSGTGTQSQVRLRLRAGQTIIIVVDGWGTSAGSYVLNIAGLIVGETNCTDGIDNDFDGALDCADSDCAGDPSCPPAP